jgi:hypothetical protein
MLPWEREFSQEGQDVTGPWDKEYGRPSLAGTQESSNPQGEQPIGEWIPLDEYATFEEVGNAEGTRHAVVADGKMEAWKPLPAPQPTIADPYPKLSFQTESGAPPPAPEKKKQSPAPSEGTIINEPLLKSFSVVEGYRNKSYQDSQGKTTVGVGFNMDQSGAKKIWEQAGVDQDFDAIKSGKEELSDPNIKKLFSVTFADSESKAQQRAKKLGIEWDTLPEWHRAILTDIAFNTKDINVWKKVFLNTNPLDVLREARRTEGGKHTKGMDNRVARIGLSLGLIHSVKEARAAGLELADLSKAEETKLAQEKPEETIPPTLAEESQQPKPWERDFGVVS